MASYGIKRKKAYTYHPPDLFDTAQKLDLIEYTDEKGRTACETTQIEYFDTPELGDKASYEVINEAQAKEKMAAARKIKNWAEQIMSSVKSSAHTKFLETR